MLSANDYSHIKLLYEQLYKLNKRITDLINESDWDSINFALIDKNNLISKIVQFEKPRLNDIKENNILNSKRIELYKMEKKNLELIKSKKEEMLSQFKNIKKAKKVLNAYEPNTKEAKSTIEFLADD